MKLNSRKRVISPDSNVHPKARFRVDQQDAPTQALAIEVVF
jgi:hypothetical protein